ncbi:HTH domain-containing protein [Peribacillus simplex]|nr:HTH domain-containing protein [Peribacillus simplex]
MLTTREYRMVRELLQTVNAIRIKDLSEEFCVSVRTIKNDLDNVRSWFKEQGVTFHSQPNKGIWIECLEVERIYLRNKMEQIGKSEMYPDQSIRVHLIIGYLLIQPGYVTAQMLADYLDVSRNTIINDLNLVDEYVKPWIVHLERKQRSGYQLVGEEKYIRLLYEHIIREDLSHDKIYQIIMCILNEEENQDVEWALGDGLLFSYNLAMKYMRKELKQIEKNLHKQSELITLLIRLMVSVTRLSLGYSLGSYRLLKRDKCTKPQESFLLKVMDNIFEEAELALLESEFLYISGGMFEETKQIDSTYVTKQIIRYVSEKENINYDNDMKLYSNLLAHLSLRLQSGTTYLEEINPFTNEINKNHSTLIQAIKEACQFYLGNYVILAQESFCAFIALHFLVSYENKLIDKRKKAKAIYVCATGHGVARLIKNKVEREIPDIHIFAYCSIMEVDEICKKEQIDLIVSVFPIEANIPVIVVNPLPTKSDLKSIKKEVEAIISCEYRQVDNFITNESYEERNMESEAISQEIIVKGYEVYQEIIFGFFKEADQQNKRNALMMHIFLMVHRYYFGKQYDYFSYSNENLNEKDERTKQKLQEIMEKNNLQLNDAELTALLQYFK